MVSGSKWACCGTKYKIVFMNILTFDIEEWFHLLDNDSTRTEKEWMNYETRINQNVGRIMDVLESTDTKATFFIVGWIAKRYPEVVKQIAEKYEIASHTMSHQLVYEQGRAKFKEDVSASIKLLEDISGKKVVTFRAPGFSIREGEAWAFEVLAECGVECDCSVFPAHHAHGGIASFRKAVPSIIEHRGIRMKEFPISSKSILGKPVVFSGGGYFRLFPYFLIKKWTQESEEYLLSYIHPRDMDDNQPMIKELNGLRRFKSYYGLKGAEHKLRKWLSEFDFVDIETANKMTNWEKAPIIKL